VPQSSPWQMYGEQSVVPPLTQLPLPSQMSALVFVEPTQLCGAQGVPATHWLQAPEPSHMPSKPQVLLALTAHSRFGSVAAAAGAQAPEPLHAMQVPHSSSGSLLLEKNVQVPTLPARLHVRQKPAQSLLQQTPSTQLLLRHCTFSAQASPSDRILMQVIPTHLEPDEHCRSDVQLVRQAESLHR
jgi:hypothetical protein